jgi:hypothetical protein
MTAGSTGAGSVFFLFFVCCALGRGWPRFGVVARLCVGSDGWVGYPDADDLGFVSVLEEVRVERLLVQVQQATLAAVFEFE